VSGEPVRHLHAVDALDGEVIPDDIASLKRELARKDAIIKGLQRDVRGWSIRYREAIEDRAQEAREHPLWPVGELLFRAWRRRCKHPNSKWTPDRFWACEPFLARPTYGKELEQRVALCCRAIAGIGYDAWAPKRKNGTVKRMDKWETNVFGSADAFEEACNRAPLGWEPTMSPELLAAVALAKKRLERMKEAA
jgi:hypothetical protein